MVYLNEYRNVVSAYVLQASTPTLQAKWTEMIDKAKVELVQLCTISSLYFSMVNIKLKYNFVETSRMFIIAKLSIRKLVVFPQNYILICTITSFKLT